MNKNNHLVEFGKLVAELRRKKGWTQTELGELTQLAYQLVATIENGRRNTITPDVLNVLANVFDLEGEDRRKFFLKASGFPDLHLFSATKLKIFLCHSSIDKPRVRNLHQNLITDGFDTWLDEKNLLPGQDWDFEIGKAIRESNVVIVCLSKASIDKEGYIQKEIRKALNVADEKPEGVIFIIPVKLDECIVPDRLSRWHWVNLFETDGYGKLKQSLKIREQNLQKQYIALSILEK